MTLRERILMRLVDVVDPRRAWTFCGCAWLRTLKSTKQQALSSIAFVPHRHYALWHTAWRWIWKRAVASVEGVVAQQIEVAGT